MAELDTILSTICEMARPLIRSRFHANSCIASTRVLCRVLHHYGYTADGLAVEVFICNEAYARLLASGIEMPMEDRATYHKWLDERGAWNIGLGYFGNESKMPEDRHAAHVICAMPKHGIILDASINQAERPQRGICLPGVLLGREAWKLIKAEAPVDYSNHGVHVIYTATPDLRWQHAPDWQDKSKTQKIVTVLTRLIDQREKQRRGKR